MKKTLGFLAFCLSFCLLAAGIPLSVFLTGAQESDPWALGDTTYASLDEAISAAADGDTVRLCRDLSESLTVDLSGKRITLEGVRTEDGYPTVTGGSAPALTAKNGTLTLKNLNLASSVTGAKGALECTGDIDITLENANITSTGSGIIIRTGTAAVTLNSGTVSSTARNGIETIKNTTLTLTVTDGTVLAKSYCISANAAPIRADIRGGVFTSQGTAAITGGYLTVTVTGGSFSAKVGSNVGCLYTKGEGSIRVLGGSYSGGACVYQYDSERVIRYPDATAKLDLKPVTLNGASIRLVPDSRGIRFESAIATDWINHIKSVSIDLTYGTLILPADLLKNAELTHDTATALDIPAKNGISEADGETVLRAALVNLKSGNEARGYAARAYLRFTVDGTVYTVYAAFNSEEHIRSMVQVAGKALADVRSTAEGEYTVPVTEWLDQDGTRQNGIAYTCYTAEEWNMIWSYVNSAVSAEG